MRAPFPKAAPIPLSVTHSAARRRTARIAFPALAFSLVETMLAAAVASAVGLAIFSVTNAGMLLAGRNLSVNLTNNAERNVLDRVEQLVQQADTMPVLIDTAGASATGPAPGISFDYFLGGPYIITVAGVSLPATTSVLTLVRSTNAVASPPLPQPGDVVIISSASSSIRALISATTVGAPDGLQHQAITATLASALGTAVTVPSSGVLTATLVRKVAFIVMPSGSGRELRYYKSFETTLNLADPTKYVLLTDQIGMQSDDATPFSLSQIQSANFVGLSLRVRSNKFDQRLSGKQADQVNTFSRIDCYIRPKINPQ